MCLAELYKSVWQCMALYFDQASDQGFFLKICLFLGSCLLGQCRIQRVFDTGIRVWAPKLMTKKNKLNRKVLKHKTIVCFILKIPS